jgi:putative peptidoglycan lipid II flippase
MSLFKSTVIVSLFTFASRISGFVRDQVTVFFFGTTLLTDAFYVVFRIPNFMRRLFAEGSFSMAFVPVLNDIKATQSNELLKEFIDRVAGTLISIVLIVWMLMEIFAPQVLWLTAPSWNTSQPKIFQEAVGWLRYTLFYFPFIVMVAFAGGILNSHKKFALPAATPILLNVSLILSMFFLRDNFEIPEKSLAIGVLIAGILQLVVQVPALIKLGLFPKFKFGFKDKKVKKVMKLMVPTLFGSSVAQINVLLDTIIATWLVAGSVTYVYLSERLLEFPLGIFAIAISTVILPTLSQQFAKEDKNKFVKTMRWALNLGFLIAIPAATGLTVLAHEVVVTLFQHGEFGQKSTQMVSISVMAYMLALPAFILNKILLPAYYSRKDTKTPVKIGIIAMFSNMGFNLIFVGILWYFDFFALHVGLALASALSGWMQTLMLYRGLRKANVIPKGVIDWNVVIKIAVASFLMGLSLYFVIAQLGNWSDFTWYGRLIRLLGCIGFGAFVFFSTLAMMKIKIKQMLVH